MRALERQLSVGGHILRQIWREGDVAIYERARAQGKEPHELELIIIKQAKEAKLPDGTIVPEHEAYPSASGWGKVGWSIPIRYKAWVLALAQKLVGIREARAGFVHEALRALWAEEQRRGPK